MGMTDPIADMLTRIRNAIMASYDTVDIPVSKLRINLGKVLKSEGFIRNYKVLTNRQRGVIRIFLKYDENGQPIITGLKRVSRPGRRVYAKSDRIPRILDGYGINILSTSKGIITDKDARELGVGGEILCSVW